MNEIIFPGNLRQALQSKLILPGSRILLRGGYYDTGDLAISINGIPEARIIITNYPGEQAIIRPSSGYRGILFSNVRYLTLDGLIIDGVQSMVECIKITDGSDHIDIINSEFMNAIGQGILITDPVTHAITIVHNKIHGNGKTKYDHGVYCGGATDVSIKLNEIYSNAGGHGIHVYSSKRNAIIAVEDNYVHDNNVGIGVYYGSCTVRNNIARSNPYNIVTRYELESAMIVNNTCVNGEINIANLTVATDNSINIINNVAINGNMGIHLEGKVLIKIPISNNLCFGNIKNYVIDDAINGILSNNLEAEFKPYIDDGAINIKPLFGNPAIGSGMIVSGMNTDISGAMRSQQPTIGAWEYK